MVRRLAPDGSQLTIDVPDTLGDLEWFGVNRFAGPRLNRDFYVAAVGQEKVIPTKLLPGASKRVFSRKGYDVVLYEAADRSDSVLLWVGPHHTATTWFGGPAPRPDVLSKLIALVQFSDSPEGATVKPTSTTLVEQHGIQVIGRNDEVAITVSPAAAATLPEWKGLASNGREVWREQLNTGEEVDTSEPYAWRYRIANTTAVVDVTFFSGPPTAAEAARAGFRAADVATQESNVTAVVDGLQATWGR